MLSTNSDPSQRTEALSKLLPKKEAAFLRRSNLAAIWADHRQFTSLLHFINYTVWYVLVANYEFSIFLTLDQSSIMQSYAGLVRGEPETGHGNGLSHITHCFDYIRQGILCSGDTTLEGRAIHEGEKLPIGWGSYHDCKDWTQIVDWADSRQPWDGPYYPDFL